MLTKNQPQRGMHYDDEDEYRETRPRRTFQVAITSFLMLAACGAVTYNTLFGQDRPAGTTALKVDIRDVDIDPELRKTPPKSVNDLLDRNAGASPLIANVQRELRALGIYKGPVDARFGARTRSAIVAYQRQYQLTPTGNATTRLLEHIRFTRKVAGAGDITGSVPTSPPTARTLKVQQRLKLFGYAPGDLDGRMGAATRSAIRQFEKDRGLPPTGELSAHLLAELGIND